MSGSVLFVMYKPEGAARVCTASETAALVTAWNAVLAWLQGADPDNLPETRHVAHVARKAGLRTPRFPEYDIRIWSELAHGVDPLPHPASAVALHDIGHELLGSLGLRLLRTSCRWLNRVAVEMLYGRSESFREHREMLVPRLLDGPVRVELWEGRRWPLAYAAKFVTRHVLSSAEVTNLLHVCTMTTSEAVALESVCELPARDYDGAIVPA